MLSPCKLIHVLLSSSVYVCDVTPVPNGVLAFGKPSTDKGEYIL